MGKRAVQGQFEKRLLLSSEAASFLKAAGDPTTTTTALYIQNHLLTNATPANRMRSRQNRLPPFLSRAFPLH